jgi:DNA-binding response OmpR family regulator
MFSNTPTKILLVDDEEDLSRLIVSWLAEESYVVDCAYDGLEALEKISTTKYDLLILDVMLPTIDGIDICSLVRAGNSSVPIVIITAYHSSDRKKTSFETGADAYMTKPFKLSALSNCIRDLLAINCRVFSKS